MDDRIVSIAQARRILGKAVEGLSDDQLLEKVQTLHLLGREQLLYNGSNNEENSDEQEDTVEEQT